MTKAEFSKRMLNFLELELSQGVPSATESWQTLQRLGFFSSGSPDSPLTEGDLSEVARQAGLDLRTEKPEKVVNPQKVQSFLSIFGPNLQKGLLRASTSSLGQAHEVHLSPTAILRRDKRRRQPVSPADPNATARPASDSLP